MTIAAACPHCQAQFQLQDELAGKRVRCQRCQNSFSVEPSPAAPPQPVHAVVKTAPKPSRQHTTADDFDVAIAGESTSADEGVSRERVRPRREESPSRNRRKDDEDESAFARSQRRGEERTEKGGRRSKNDGPPGWVLIGVGFLCLALSGGGLWFGINFFRSLTEKHAQGLGAVPSPLPGPGPGPLPGPGPQPVGPKLAAWTVQPDPLPASARAPFDTTTVVQVGDGGALFPTTPAPFAALVPVPPKGQEASLQAYDLRSMKPIGKPIQRKLLPQHLVVSPDGEYVAGVAKDRTIDVFSFLRGERARSIPVDKPGNIVLVDFAGKDRLFTAVESDGGTICQTWDITTGKVLGEFKPSIENLHWKWLTFSPGRRYFMLQETAGGNGYFLHFFELSTGKLAGQLEMQPQSAAWGQSSGIAFSQDGEELTVMWRLNNQECWAKMMIFDLKTGKKLPELKLEKLVSSIESLWYVGGTASIQYLPDRGRWLLFNHLIVDRQSGQVVGKVGGTPGWTGDIGTRRFLDASHFASPTRVGWSWQVKVEALPAQGAFQLDDKSPPKVYLSDLEPVQENVGWGKLGRKGMLGYGIKQGETDRKIKVGGKEDPNGISMHPPDFQGAFARYQLNRKAKTFRASVGINDLDPGESGKMHGPLIFKVFGDGKQLWESNPHQTPGQSQSCQVDVSGVNVLELHVHCSRGKAFARAVWLDAHVQR